jgi:hypothetical protein
MAGGMLLLVICVPHRDAADPALPDDAAVIRVSRPGYFEPERVSDPVLRPLK